MGQHDHERSEFLRQRNFPEFFIIFIFNFFDLFLKIKIKGIEGALSSCAPNFSKGRNFPQFFRGGGRTPFLPGIVQQSEKTSSFY